MVPPRTHLLIAAGALTLSACAGAEAPMNDLASRVDAQSTCHTSSGQWVGTGRECAVSYSISKTVSTTTTTTTTVETPPASPAVAPGEDDS